VSEDSEESTVDDSDESREETSYVERVLEDISAARATSAPASQESKTPDTSSKKSNVEQIAAVYSIEKEMFSGYNTEEVRTEEWTTPVIEDDDEDEEEEEEDPEESPRQIQRQMEMLEGKFARQLFSLRCIYFVKRRVVFVLRNLFVDFCLRRTLAGFSSFGPVFQKLFSHSTLTLGRRFCVHAGSICRECMLVCECVTFCTMSHTLHHVFIYTCGCTH
jgi:hypothetical protein